MRACLAAILLLAEAVRADGLRGAASAGLGIGHDILGLQLEAGAGQWSGFTALTAFPGLNPSNALLLGARWSRSADGAGLSIALQALVWKSNTGADEPETITVVSTTAHWRWRWAAFFVDVGAGPAVSFDSWRRSRTDLDLPPSLRGRLTRTACFGIPREAGCHSTFPVDLELGLGLAL